MEPGRCTLGYCGNTLLHGVSEGANGCVRRRNGLLLLSRPEGTDSFVALPFAGFASQREMGTSFVLGGSRIRGRSRPVGTWILAGFCYPQRREPGALRLYASPLRQNDRLGCSNHRCITGRAWIASRLAFLLPLMDKSFGFFYFPIQKLLKIKFRISSVVVSPVMASSGRRAP